MVVGIVALVVAGDRVSDSHTRDRVASLAQRLDRLEARFDKAEAERFKKEHDQMKVELETMLGKKPP